MCHVVIKLTRLWLFLCCRLLSWNLSGKCGNVHQYVPLQKLFMFASQQWFFFVPILLRESLDSGAGIWSQSHVFLLEKGSNCRIDWTCYASILWLTTFSSRFHSECVCMQYFNIPVNNVPLRFIVCWDRSDTDCVWFVGCPAGHISAAAATACTSAWLCTNC